MQFSLEFPETLSQNLIGYHQSLLSLTECVWEFRSNALWDALFHEFDHLSDVSKLKCMYISIPQGAGILINH